jgi:two-component system, NarL family, nitrate/nitrite response regulator NarL
VQGEVFKVQVRNHKIRVLLADGNLMASRLLSQALGKNPEFSVVGCVAEPDQLAAEMKRLRPDVLLASLHVANSGANRFAALRTVTADFPNVPCVLLLNRSDCETVVDAFRAGVKGVFSCSEGDTKALEKCIQRVVEGQVWADTAQLHFILAALLEQRVLRPRTRKTAPGLLTPREEQVVQLVAVGMGNREIAVEMHISENTVKNYLFKIFEKLGFSNRVELVLYVMSRHDAEPQEGGAIPVGDPVVHKSEAPELSTGKTIKVAAAAFR